MTPDEVQPPENPPTSGDKDVQGVVDGAHEQLRPTRRTAGILAAVLLAVALATGASSAQASSNKLTLRQVKTAIGRFATQVAIDIDREAPKEEERVRHLQQPLHVLYTSLHDCETKEGGGLCLVSFRYTSGMTCTEGEGVLPAKPTGVRFIELSAMKCEASGGNEQRYDGPRSPTGPPDRQEG